MAFQSKYAGDAHQSIGFLYEKVFNQWHLRIKKALEHLEITHPQFVVMTTLGFLRQSALEVTQVDIAAMADIDVMTISQILKVLEREKIVLRQPHSQDKRAKSVVLTEKGEIILAEAIPMVEKIDDDYFGELGESGKAFKQHLQNLLIKNKEK